MEFSTWLLITEDTKNLSNDAKTASVLSEILIKAMETTGIIEERLSFGNLGMRPRNPGRFYKPGGKTKPIWVAPKEKEEEEQEGIYRKIKDSMMLLRYKAMSERKSKVDELKTLKMPADEERTLDILEELGYVKPGFYKKSESKKQEELKDLIKNAQEESGNEVPEAYVALVNSGDINKFKSEFIKLISYMYEKNHLQYDGDALEKMIDQITRRTASSKSMKARDWTWPWLVSTKEETEDQIRNAIKNAMGTISFSNSGLEKRKEKYMRTASAFRATTGEDGEEASPMTNAASPRSSSEPEKAEQKRLIFSKFSNIMNQLKSRDKLTYIAFCVKFGLNPNGLNTIDDLVSNQLRKDSKSGDSRKASEQIAEKMLAYLPQAEQHLVTPERAGKLALAGTKFVRKQICDDEALKNSDYGWIFDCRWFKK